GQKVIIAPDGSDAWAPAKARPDETLIRALARAHRWNRMLETGKCRSIAEIAEAEKIDRSFVSRLLDLTLLAPDIQEAILDGRQAKGLQLEELTRVIPSRWEKQWELLLPCAIMYHNKRLRAGPHEPEPGYQAHEGTSERSQKVYRVIPKP
ncbi:MAG: hypothetical protein ACM32G_08020, partial [Betaproteobacteria bacterium]